MKTVRVRLWRLRPPFTRAVILRPITVQGFLDLLRIWMTKASAQRLMLRRDLTGKDLLESDSREEFIASGDLFVDGEDPEWLRAWASDRNLGRLIAASTRIHNWRRLFGIINLSGERNRGPGMMGDVQTMARIWGIDPLTVLGWPMTTFLDLCDSLAISMKHAEYQADPTLDPNAEAAPVNLPGLPVVH